MPTSAIPLRRRIARQVFRVSMLCSFACLIAALIPPHLRAFGFAYLAFFFVAVAIQLCGIGRIRGDVGLALPDRRSGLDRRRGGSLPQPYRSERRRAI
jgi:hypothetical protein